MVNEYVHVPLLLHSIFCSLTTAQQLGSSTHSWTVQHVFFSVISVTEKQI
jgi:hypothetical protein